MAQWAIGKDSGRGSELNGYIRGMVADYITDLMNWCYFKGSGKSRTQTELVKLP